MLIQDAIMKAVGSTVKDLDVIVTTAGKADQVDKSLLPKQGEQKWQQKLGLTDTSGHIWAIATITAGKSYNPIIRGSDLLVKEATIGIFTNKGGEEEKRLLIVKYELPKFIGDPANRLDGKPKQEGILDPMVENVLAKYDIAATEALWPCTRKNTKTGVVTTNWIIYHRYCEQIAAKANIVFDKPQLIVNTLDEKGKRTVVLLVTGRLGYIQEWSYGEASPSTTFLPYVFAMAEKRAKDRVILKLAGFHGMVYSDAEENWKNGK